MPIIGNVDWNTFQEQHAALVHPWCWLATWQHSTSNETEKLQPLSSNIAFSNLSCHMQTSFEEKYLLLSFWEMPLFQSWCPQRRIWVQFTWEMILGKKRVKEWWEEDEEGEVNQTCASKVTVGQRWLCYTWSLRNILKALQNYTLQRQSVRISIHYPHLH